MGMGNWNSHPDQEINRDPPPIQFQDNETAEEFYPELTYFNDYGWMYILGGVVILFLVMGCCVCLCKIGAKDAQPGPGTPMGANSMYDALPEKMPKGFTMKKKSKKQPSMIYPTMSPAHSMYGGQVPGYP